MRAFRKKKDSPLGNYYNIISGNSNLFFIKSHQIAIISFLIKKQFIFGELINE